MIPQDTQDLSSFEQPTETQWKQLDAFCQASLPTPEELPNPTIKFDRQWVALQWRVDLKRNSRKSDCVPSKQMLQTPSGRKSLLLLWNVHDQQQGELEQKARGICHTEGDFSATLYSFGLSSNEPHTLSAVGGLLIYVIRFFPFYP